MELWRGGFVPSRDLHSGICGGPALNPLRMLFELLAALHDEKSRVAIPGFYDDVRNPSPAELAVWRGLGFDAGDFLGGVGLSAEPQKILDGLHRFVEGRLPAEASVSFAKKAAQPPWASIRKRRRFKPPVLALQAEWGKKPVVVGCGFALEHIHSPNEKYNLRSFTKGARSWARILAELGAIDAVAAT